MKRKRYLNFDTCDLSLVKLFYCETLLVLFYRQRQKMLTSVKDCHLLEILRIHADSRFKHLGLTSKKKWTVKKFKWRKHNSSFVVVIIIIIIIVVVVVVVIIKVILRSEGIILGIGNANKTKPFFVVEIITNILIYTWSAVFWQIIFLSDKALSFVFL